MSNLNRTKRWYTVLGERELIPPWASQKEICRKAISIARYQHIILIPSRHSHKIFSHLLHNLPIISWNLKTLRWRLLSLGSWLCSPVLLRNRNRHAPGTKIIAVLISSGQRRETVEVSFVPSTNVLNPLLAYTNQYIGWDPAVLENQIKHSDHVPHDAPVENVLFHCSADGLAVATAEYCECRCVETGEGGENDYCSREYSNKIYTWENTLILVLHSLLLTVKRQDKVTLGPVYRPRCLYDGALRFCWSRQRDMTHKHTLLRALA